MESNRRTLMFLILIAIAFGKLAVGDLTERARCLRNMIYFCGGMDKPNIDDCGKWAVLRFSERIPGVPHYISSYFKQNILPGITTSGMKTPSRFCRDRIRQQFKSNYGKGSSSFGAGKKRVLYDDDYDEGSSSSEIEKKFVFYDAVEKKNKFALRYHCINNLATFTAGLDIREIIEIALIRVNLNTYKDPYTFNYENNETAKDYLKHISDTIIVTKRYRCLHHMKYFCGGMNKPSIDDCGKWAVLRYRHGISDVPNYIHYYLEQNILRGITAPGMKTTNKFCSDRVEKQLESNNYRNRMFHHMDFLAKASDYDEGSSSSEAGKNLELDDGETKLKFMKFRLIFQCLDNLAKYTETVRNDIIEFPLYYINELSENTATYRRYIIEYALLCVNLDTFENPNTYNYENNEAAKDYLIHISDMVKVSNRQAQDPVKYCIYIDRPKSNFLPNEMFPFK